MNLEGLRTFVLAVELGSLTAAARAVGRTQPAVTVQIQNLEREAGDRLLVRGARGVRATRSGEILCGRARAILREAEDLIDELRAVGSLRRGRLRIGATDVMALYFLPRILMRFRRTYPGIQVTVAVEGSRALAQRVLSGELDLGLVTLPLEHPNLSVQECHRERVDFVAARDHALAGRRRLTLAELAAEPMIHHKADSVTREAVATVFRMQGLEPRVAMEVSSPEAIKELVAVGLGIAPLSRAQVRAEVERGRLVRLPAPGFICWRRSGVVRRRDAPPPRSVSAFLALLPQRDGRRAARPR